jgi:hypothetical protein
MVKQELSKNQTLQHKKMNVKRYQMMVVVVCLCLLPSCVSSRHALQAGNSVKIISLWKKCVDESIERQSRNEKDVYALGLVSYSECDNFENILMNDKLLQTTKESAFAETSYIKEDMKMYAMKQASKTKNIDVAGKNIEDYSACLAEMMQYYFEKKKLDKKDAYVKSIEACVDDEIKCRESLKLELNNNEVEYIIQYARTYNKQLFFNPKYGK